VRTYFTRRVIGAVPLLIGIAVISFLFMHAMPGGPTTLLARNSRMTARQLENVKRSMGLDQPVPVQLGRWLVNVARGDLGLSFTQFRPVAQIIAERVGPTMRLMTVAMGMSIVLALGAGLLSALRRYSWADTLITAVSFVGLAMPVFWLGLMLQLLFSVQLGWLPAADMTKGNGPFDDLRHIILPAFTLAFGTIASWSRYVRSSMLETINLDYIRTARAKGLDYHTTVTRHALRNALIPFVTVIAIDIPLFLTGAVVTETIFSWPGLGRLFFDALRARDYPVLMGLLVYSAALIVAFGIIADLIYALLNPRIRYR
jgi:peptide/nickel transport system permease protein